LHTSHTHLHTHTPTYFLGKDETLNAGIIAAAWRNHLLGGESNISARVWQQNLKKLMACRRRRRKGEGGVNAREEASKISARAPVERRNQCHQLKRNGEES